MCRSGCNSCCNNESTVYRLGGTIYGIHERPVGAGIPVEFIINGVSNMTYIDSNGGYSMRAPRNASVTIRPNTGVGVVVTLPYYTLSAVDESNMNYNFYLSVV